MKEQECRALYREAFADPDTLFEDELFSHCFCYVKTLEENGKVISMLFALPCVIQTGQKTVDAAYLYAVATRRSERGKGHMHRLLESVRQEFQTAFLVPANESLIGFYESCGFSRVLATARDSDRAAVVPTGGFSDLVKGRKDSDKETFPAMVVSKIPLDLEGLYFPYRMG